MRRCPRRGPLTAPHFPPAAPAGIRPPGQNVPARRNFSPNEPITSAGDPLDAIIAEYVQQVEAGAVPDREALLAQHPDLAERLRAFLADFDRLDRRSAPFRRPKPYH